MLLNLGRRGGLRRAGAIVAGLLLVMTIPSSISAAGPGDGRMTVTPTTATYGATGQIFTFDFWNDTTWPFIGPLLGSHGAKVELTIPAGWTAPTTAAGAGHIAVVEGAHAAWHANFCDPGSAVIGGTGPWTIRIPMTCWLNDHLTITYSGVTVPAAMTYTFTTRTQGSATNFANIAVQPTVTVNKADQTITFATAPTGVTVGASGVSVGATSSSGLAVSYSPITPLICTVDGSTGALTLLAVGTCTIAADQAGNPNWLAAPQVTQDVAVGLKAQTITFAAAPTGATVGASSVSVSATASSGLAVTYSSTTPLICTVDGSTGALTLLAVGTCTIAADQSGDGTYAAALQATQDVAVGGTAQLTLVKAAVQTTFTKAGDTIDYTYTLANTGNVPLDGPFTVKDDKIAAVTCPDTKDLAVGASIVCTGTYMVTLADLDAGKVVNTATAQGVFERADVISVAQVVTVSQKPVSSVAAATGTPPPTSTGSGSSSSNPTPLLALLICLGFAGLGLLAAQAQRRSIRR